MRETHSYPAIGGHALGMVDDRGTGKSQSDPRDQLDPLFIEICRRIRLEAGHERSASARSKWQRTRARDCAKATRERRHGDPWTPINIGRRARCLRSATIECSASTMHRSHGLEHWFSGRLRSQVVERRMIQRTACRSVAAAMVRAAARPRATTSAEFRSPRPSSVCFPAGAADQIAAAGHAAGGARWQTQLPGAAASAPLPPTRRQRG